MAPRRSQQRPSVLLLVLLGCALAVGAAVSLIATARTAGPPPPVGPSNEFIFPPWLISTAIVGFGLAILLPILYARLRTTGTSSLTGPFATAAFAILLSGIVLVALLHALGGGGGGFQTVSGPPTNDTKGTMGNQSTNNSTIVTGPGGVLVPLGFHLPPWALFAIVALILVGVVVAGLPPLADYLQERRERRLERGRLEEVAVQVQIALRRASQELDGSLDPRATILALYATLLTRIEPLTPSLDMSTAEEIRRMHLTRLGIRDGAAEDLTRVFEEARYSSHPLGREEVGRAADAIRSAEEDLARAGRPPP